MNLSWAFSLQSSSVRWQLEHENDHSRSNYWLIQWIWRSLRCNGNEGLCFCSILQWWRCRSCGDWSQWPILERIIAGLDTVEQNTFSSVSYHTFPVSLISIFFSLLSSVICLFEEDVRNVLCAPIYLPIIRCLIIVVFNNHKTERTREVGVVRILAASLRQHSRGIFFSLLPLSSHGISIQTLFPFLRFFIIVLLI